MRQSFCPSVRSSVGDAFLLHTQNECLSSQKVYGYTHTHTHAHFASTHKLFFMIAGECGGGNGQ